MIKQNVFFLLIDAFSADSFYGEKCNSRTPNIDFMVKNGVSFAQSITCAPQTSPSISSMFTALFPFNSTLKIGGHFQINPSVETCVKILKNSGYHTYAMIPEIISYTRVTKDFDEFETYNSGLSMHEGIGNQIIKQLENKMKNPWFFYVHSLDIHGTASGLPKEFDLEKYGKNQYERKISATDVWIGKFLEKIDAGNTLFVLTADHGNETSVYSRDLEMKKNKIFKYNSEPPVKPISKLAKKLLKESNPLRKKLRKIYLEKKSKDLENRKNEEFEKIKTLTLSPYDKRILENMIKPISNVFDDKFKIPILFYGAGINIQKIIHNQVRSIDIFPTILDLLEIKEKPQNHTGISLQSLFSGDVKEDRPAYVESGINHSSQKTENVIGIRLPNWKYFRDKDESKKNIHLYNLIQDPHEENNIYSTNPDRVKTMENILQEILKERVSVSDQNEFDPKEEELIENELKKLGYL